MQWQPRGHSLGHCYNYKDLMYIPIPKNASTWSKDKFKQLGWNECNYLHHHLYHKHSIVILRDPIERWVSGMVEYFSRLQSSTPVEMFTDIILNQCALDEHTYRQAYYISGINFNNATFFYCKENYKNDLTKFLKEHNINVDYTESIYRNVMKTNKQYLKDYFQSLIKDSAFLPKLKNYYECDYQIIRSVKYY